MSDGSVCSSDSSVIEVWDTRDEPNGPSVTEEEAIKRALCASLQTADSGDAHDETNGDCLKAPSIATESRSSDISLASTTEDQPLDVDDTRSLKASDDFDLTSPECEKQVEDDFEDQCVETVLLPPPPVYAPPPRTSQLLPPQDVENSSTSSHATTQEGSPLKAPIPAVLSQQALPERRGSIPDNGKRLLETTDGIFSATDDNADKKTEARKRLKREKKEEKKKKKRGRKKKKHMEKESNDEPTLESSGENHRCEKSSEAPDQLYESAVSAKLKPGPIEFPVREEQTPPKLLGPSPYEKIDVEHGEGLFEEVKGLFVAAENEGGQRSSRRGLLPSKKLINAFDNDVKVASAVLQTYHAIERAKIAYSPSWIDGLVGQTKLTKISKDCLLICLQHTRLSCAEQMNIQKIILDLEVYKSVVEALQKFGISDDHPLLFEALQKASSEPIYARALFQTTNDKFKRRGQHCAIFIARAYRCASLLGKGHLELSLANNIRACLDTMYSYMCNFSTSSSASSPENTHEQQVAEEEDPQPSKPVPKRKRVDEVSDPSKLSRAAAARLIPSMHPTSAQIHTARKQSNLKDTSEPSLRASASSRKAVGAVSTHADDGKIRPDRVEEPALNRKQTYADANSCNLSRTAAARITPTTFSKTMQVDRVKTKTKYVGALENKLTAASVSTNVGSTMSSASKSDLSCETMMAALQPMFERQVELCRSSDDCVIAVFANLYETSEATEMNLGRLVGRIREGCDARKRFYWRWAIDDFVSDEESSEIGAAEFDPGKVFFARKNEQSQPYRADVLSLRGGGVDSEDGDSQMDSVGGMVDSDYSAGSNEFKSSDSDDDDQVPKESIVDDVEFASEPESIVEKLSVDLSKRVATFNSMDKAANAAMMDLPMFQQLLNEDSLIHDGFVWRKASKPKLKPENELSGYESKSANEVKSDPGLVTSLPKKTRGASVSRHATIDRDVCGRVPPASQSVPVDETCSTEAPKADETPSNCPITTSLEKASSKKDSSAKCNRKKRKSDMLLNVERGRGRSFPIEQISLQTKKVLCTYQTQTAICAALNMAPTTFRQQFGEGNVVIRGYFWRYQKSDCTHLNQGDTIIPVKQSITGKGNVYLIDQICLETKKVIKTWYSQKAVATQALKMHRDKFRDLMKDGEAEIDGYLWRYQEGQKRKCARRKARPIEKVSIRTGAVLGRYDTQVAACQAAGVERMKFRGMMEESPIQHQGFIWRYVGEAPSKEDDKKVPAK